MDINYYTHHYSGCRYDQLYNIYNFSRLITCKPYLVRERIETTGIKVRYNEHLDPGKRSFYYLLVIMRNYIIVLIYYCEPYNMRIFLCNNSPCKNVSFIKIC